MNNLSQQKPLDGSTRVAWIDAVKGICIILMIYGHSNLPEELKTIFYTFHMPAFFILSGYTFTFKYANWSEFAKKRLLPLLKAYFFFSIIALLWSRIKYMIGAPELDMLHAFLGIFINIRCSDFSGTGMWFLTALISGYIVFYLLTRYFYDNSALLIIIAIVQFIIWDFYTKFYNLMLPWAFDVSLLVSIYLTIGYLLKKHNIIGYLISNKLFIVISLILWIFMFMLNLIVSNKGYVRTDIYSNMYGCPILFLICSIMGTISVSLLLSHAKQENFLCKLGKKTLIIYGLHGIPNSAFVFLINKITIFNNYIYEIITATIIVLLDLSIIFLVMKINRKYLHIQVLY